MNFNVRGTSGSGKSTVMMDVMHGLGPWGTQMVGYRKQPLYYYNKQDVVVLGHYNSPCGGCDTIGSAGEVYKLLKELENGTNYGRRRRFLMEGLLLSEDTKWCSQLEDVTYLYLTTSLEQCLAQIKERRAKAGNEKPLNPENTSKRVKVVERSRLKLLELGKVCKRVSPEQAVRIILRELCEPR